jgi:hypothetical protein
VHLLCKITIENTFWRADKKLVFSVVILQRIFEPGLRSLGAKKKNKVTIDLRAVEAISKRVEADHPACEKF